MEIRRGLVILNGKNNRGAVKFTLGRMLKGECVLERSVASGVLYVGNDEISKITLNGARTAFELPHCSEKSVSCLVRGNGEKLFGKENGSVGEDVFLKRIERFENDLVKEPSDDLVEEQSNDVEPVIEDEVKTDQTVQNQQSNAVKCAPRISAEKQKDIDATSHVLDEGIRYSGDNFYKAVKPQIDEMFVRYPSEKRLNDTVPNSRWIRVDGEDGDYVVGVLYDVDQPIFICYGIPGSYSRRPPKEIDGVCVWLPLNVNEREGEGYWIIYQDAATGKCVR